MSAPRLLAPEFIQSSAMDCGPASLLTLLEGFGIRVGYGRLREACQTDVDGTSIDTLEDVGRGLGLDAEQIVVPIDHVLRGEAEALPALAVVVQPGGPRHFLVIWRSFGPWVQIMDPASGRAWVRRDALLRRLYVHVMPAPAEAWREWAAGEEFLGALRGRMLGLGCRARFVRSQLDAALADPSWASLAGLDAGVRMLADMIAIGGLARGAEVERALEGLLELARDDPRFIPARCWSAQALPDEAKAEYADLVDEPILVHGAVLLRVRGRREPAAPSLDSGSGAGSELCAGLTPSLVGVRDEVQLRPLRELLRSLSVEGSLRPSLLVFAMICASFGALIEAAILRGMIELGAQLGLVRERLVAWIALLAFAFILLILEAVLATQLRGLGRRLELRLRLRFLDKVPRLGARYFQSRLSSDMAERLHAMHGLRGLPALGEQIVRSTASLVFTVLGVAWLDPASALVAGAGALALVACSALALPTLRERDLRFRSHGGALSRVYLDALLGLWPIRAHGAARAVRREHETLLVEWTRAGLDLLRASVSVEVIQGLVAMIAVILVVARHALVPDEAQLGAEIGATLLLVYWSMQLPGLGQQLGAAIRQYPGLRSRAVRLLEPLGAPDEDQLGGRDEGGPGLPERGALGLRFEDVTVVASGHVLLDRVNLEIGAGEHVAIVGASGAGKSTLVGALLGWHRPVSGRIQVAGGTLEGRRLVELRRRSAWIDPAIALWNEPLLDNLLYGASEPERALDGIGAVLAQADLRELVANLPEGLQTELGEGGGVLSGGEGQRVRLGRALLRPDVGLAILDEALRGLDRRQRRAVLERLRARWSDATLLCVTHDIEETLGFTRVIVVEDGRVVEDGDPRALAQTDGAYATMLAQERGVHAHMWGQTQWRRIQIDAGRLIDEGRPHA